MTDSDAQRRGAVLMTDPDVQWRGAVLTTLESIDRSLDALVGLARKAAGVTVGDGAPVHAGDTELDQPDADEVVKMNPRDWSGDDFKGTRMSLCPPAFLEQLALVYDYFAKKNDDQGLLDTQGRPKSFYDKRTARRARGWAARLRATAGKEAPVRQEELGWSPKTW
jgi:hypothetical protein